ncbi:lytic transglycosylase domain-containing protein [Saccharopolyspora halophila]|uniref:lytic transglycosylase domain-containing protein n=1 Tax=Saccharopolyspora halophila TaxID=405551 RepID=UPI0031D3EE68
MIRISPTVLAALGRLVVAVSLLAALVVGVGLIGFFGAPPKARVAAPPESPEIEPAQVQPGAAAPPVEVPPVAPPPEQSSPGVDPIRQWANEVSLSVDVPARALVSYAAADLAMREHAPGCRISWSTIAGIGRVESNHGRYGHRQLGEDGKPSQPIIGIKLDGGPDVRRITDTDGGRLDGDTQHDRAVGPMQFIPSTWNKWATDGNGDGIGDPQNLDDAAIAAARYLCAGGRDMATGSGWWQGVMSYNNSVEYAQKVFGLAETYTAAGNRRE